MSMAFFSCEKEEVIQDQETFNKFSVNGISLNSLDVSKNLSLTKSQFAELEIQKQLTRNTINKIDTTECDSCSSVINRSGEPTTMCWGIQGSFLHAVVDGNNGFFYEIYVDISSGDIISSKIIVPIMVPLTCLAIAILSEV